MLFVAWYLSHSWAGMSADEFLMYLLTFCILSLSVLTHILAVSFSSQYASSSTVTASQFVGY